MDRQGYLKSALEWDLKSALFESLARLGVKVTLLRYEELVRNPDTAIASTLSALGLFAGPPAIRVAETPDLVQYESLPHHTVGGNRIRFERGLVSLRGDEEWRVLMSRRQRVIVACLTLPFLMRYGYL